MPLASITWNVGCIVGPMLGGTLSTPAQQYPNSFIARVRLFQDYPYVGCVLSISLTQLPPTIRYLLPCLAGASIAFAALVFGYFYLAETERSKNRKVPTVRPPPPRPYNTSTIKPLNHPR